MLDIAPRAGPTSGSARASILDSTTPARERALLRGQRRLERQMEAADSARERRGLAADYWREHSIYVNPRGTLYRARYDAAQGALQLRRTHIRMPGSRPGHDDRSPRGRGELPSRLDIHHTRHGDGSSTNRRHRSADERYVPDASMRAATEVAEEQLRHGRVRKPSVEYWDRVTRVGTHWPVRVILHDTESYDRRGLEDIAGIFSFWRRQGRGLGAHLVIDREGKTGQGAPFRSITQAAAGANTGTIHIEQIGFARFSRRQWLNRERQLNEVAKFLAYFNHKYDIPLRRDRHTGRGVLLHRDFPQGGHTDPGPNYPLDVVLRKARRYSRLGW